MELLCPAGSLPAIKAALNNTLNEGIAIEAEEFAKLFDSHDQEEGVRAFMERDTPNWRDQ